MIQGPSEKVIMNGDSERFGQVGLEVRLEFRVDSVWCQG